MTDKDNFIKGQLFICIVLRYYYENIKLRSKKLFHRNISNILQGRPLGN